MAVDIGQVGLRGGGRVLVLVSGLPAVGKSTLAAELGSRLDAVQLSRDQVRRSAGPVWRLVDIASFRVLRRRLTSVQRRATIGLLQEVDVQLAAGRSVLVEALAEPELRNELSGLATAAAARFVIVECWCADEAEYERRLATRPRRWQELVRRLAETHQAADDALRIDTSGPPERTADSVLAAIKR